MQIPTITLKNFRGYEDTTLDLGPRTLLAGENGSGKSTVIDAIAWVLTGRCRGVDGKGSGQKDLIRAGAAEMSVALDVQPLGFISRSLALNGSPICSMKPDAILAKLGVSEGMLQAVLYGGSFFQMHHAEAKALLMALLDVKVQPADLPGLSLKRPMSLDELDVLYQTAFQNRAALKKAVVAVQVPPFDGDEALAGEDLDMLKADLKAAREQWKAATQALADHTAAQRSLQQKIQDVQADLAGRGRLEGQLAVHEETMAQHQAALDAAKGQLATVEADRAEAVDTLTASAQELRLTLTKLERHDPERGCVLAAGIPCHTAPTEFVGHIADLRKQVQALDKRVKAGTQRAETMASLRQKVKDEDRQVGYHQNQVDGLLAKLKDLDVAGVQLADNLKKQLDLGQKAEALAQEAEHRETVLATVQTNVDAVTAYQWGKAAHQKAVKEAARLQADLDAAEANVALLGPKGIRATVLQQAVGGFESLINAALEGFGFSLAIQVEPFQVLIKVHGAAPRRFELLSAGEQLWTGLAFQVALAVVSGLNFCALDAAEAVVGENRALLTGLMMNAPVDQVVVAMAKGGHEPDPDVPGLTVIRLDSRAAAAAGA